VKRLTDTSALVTGGSRGIGRAIVTALAREGSAVTFTYRSSAAQAEELVQELTAEGCTVRGVASDASSAAEAMRVVRSVVSAHGRIDILVNNAGITRDGLIIRMSEADWDDVIRNNLSSVFACSRAASRWMLTQRRGKIITITSIVGLHGNAGQANYAASKAAIMGFTRALAKELGSRNIQVNAVAPGFVATDMTSRLSDEQRLAALSQGTPRGIAQPGQVAGFVAFLASADSDLVTGQTFIVEAQQLADKATRQVQLPR
jgi:3-oxoacyl-[acyl-carrier protein] reductase